MNYSQWKQSNAFGNTTLHGRGGLRNTYKMLTGLKPHFGQWVNSYFPVATAHNWPGGQLQAQHWFDMLELENDPPVPPPVPTTTLNWNSIAVNHWTGDNVTNVNVQDTAGVIPDEPELLIENTIGALHDAVLRKMKAAEPEPKPSNRLMQDVYNYPQMKLEKNRGLSYIKSHELLKPKFPWTIMNGMVGIEVEVENITNAVHLEAFWQMKTDNSLRNNGYEFVSVPLPISQVQYALEHLYTAMRANNNPDFSNRTSIHIHLNCRDMTQDQIYVLCLLYAIFEKHFYAVAGTKRLNSIFCVPLYRTDGLKNISTAIYKFAPQWHKYTGFNILPLLDNNGHRGYGTIEFRHLYGTLDERAVMQWIDHILCLRKAALEIPKEELLAQIKEMNTNSSYQSLYTQVFPKNRLLTNKLDFEECVSNVKRELFGDEYKKSVNVTDKSMYWQLSKQLGFGG